MWTSGTFSLISIKGQLVAFRFSRVLFTNTCFGVSCWLLNNSSSTFCVKCDCMQFNVTSSVVTAVVFALWLWEIFMKLTSHSSVWTFLETGKLQICWGFFCFFFPHSFNRAFHVVTVPLSSTFTCDNLVNQTSSKMHIRNYSMSISSQFVCFCVI